MSEELVHEIARELGESDSEPVEKIAEIIAKIGIERIRLIVVATKILYDVGGLVRMREYQERIYGRKSSRKKKNEPRTLGGTFFFLVSLHPEGILFMKKQAAAFRKEKTAQQEGA